MERYTTLQWLSMLVAHQTTTDRSNLMLLGDIESYLSQYGIACTKSFDDDGRKANLLATIGDPGRPGIILSGHTDVVPAAGQQWTYEPYALTVNDGKAYGRGTCDMKGFLAVVLSLVPDFVRASGSRTVHLAFSYDEEIGCVGARRLTPLIADLPVLPAGCIVGEPTSMRSYVGHKGKSGYRVRVRGCACHSSNPENGVNAIELGAELISLLTAEGRARRERGGNPNFDPPYTTVHTGTVHGGTALNIVPSECVFDFEVRHLPGETAEEVMDRLMQRSRELLEDRLARFPGAGITVDVKSSYPGMATEENHPFVDRIAGVLGRSDRNYASFGTEGGLFSQLGVPTVILGPGSIEQAHKPDEFIELDQLAMCETVLGKLLLQH